MKEIALLSVVIYKRFYKDANIISINVPDKPKGDPVETNGCYKKASYLRVYVKWRKITWQRLRLLYSWASKTDDA